MFDKNVTTICPCTRRMHSYLHSLSKEVKNRNYDRFLKRRDYIHITLEFLLFLIRNFFKAVLLVKQFYVLYGQINMAVVVMKKQIQQNKLARLFFNICVKMMIGMKII